MLGVTLRLALRLALVWWVGWWACRDGRLRNGLVRWALATAGVRWVVAERGAWSGLVTPPAHPHP